MGWVSGAILSVVLARSHEGGEAGFTRNLWLFATFFTMSATVWMEMLAKPGALARAQGSLSSFPRPIRSLRRRSRRVSRYVQVTRIAAKHGLGRSLGVPEDDGASAAGGRAPVAIRVRRALEEGGGVFVKLGQVLSTRSDLLPPAITEELARLQDRVSLADRDAVRALLESELGEPAGSAFADFDWTPLAAASIGQVYRARLHTGGEVIVKVQRPGIAEAIERDLEVLLQLAATLEARAPWAATYRVTELANVDQAWINSKYGIPGDRYMDYAILRGDPSDGLPGVAGIGEKTASELLRKYGSLDAILAATDLSPSIRVKLTRAADYLVGARQVVPLAEDCPVESGDGAIPIGPAHADEVRALVDRYGLAGPIERLNAAVRPAGAAARVHP